MAVAIVLDFEGMTLEQYDQILKKMSLTSGGSAAPGALFHWITKTETGTRVTDVWETKAQFEKFAQEQIGPFSEEVGVPNPPSMTFYEVHSYLTTPN